MKGVTQTRRSSPGRFALMVFLGILVISPVMAAFQIASVPSKWITSLMQPVTPTSTLLFTSTATLTPTATCTPSSVPTPTIAPSWHSVPWADALKASANSFIREDPTSTLALVQSFDYVREAPGVSPQESADNTCGPLGVSILSKAGIFYPLKTPVDLRDWWEPDPRLGMPWGMLDMSHYQLYQFLTFTADGIIGNQVTRYNIPGDLNNGVQTFDFKAFPLCPGDWIYTRSVGNGFDHLWVVSEVDAQGRAYAVGNIPEATSDRFVVNRILLFDPSDPTVGGFKRNFVNHHAGTSGKAGFYLLRINDGCKTPPGYENHLVNP